MPQNASGSTKKQSRTIYFYEFTINAHIILRKEAMFVCGIVFSTAQMLAFAGWITINYGKIGRDVLLLWDADGDGKVTVSDFKIYARRLLRMLTVGLPSSASFAYGFSMGFRYLV